MYLDNKDASKLTPYIKITLGDQTLKTPGAKLVGAAGVGSSPTSGAMNGGGVNSNVNSPVWNYPGQLVFCDLEKESMWISLYIKKRFAPDG